jgi:hypothetical protein
MNFTIFEEKKCENKTGLMSEGSKNIKTILGINSLKQTLDLNKSNDHVIFFISLYSKDLSTLIAESNILIYFGLLKIIQRNMDKS